MDCGAGQRSIWDVTLSYNSLIEMNEKAGWNQAEAMPANSIAGNKNTLKGAI